MRAPTQAAQQKMPPMEITGAQSKGKPQTHRIGREPSNKPRTMPTTRRGFMGYFFLLRATWLVPRAEVPV